MEDQLVTYSTAKLLKEIGFDEVTQGYWQYEEEDGFTNDPEESWKHSWKGEVGHLPEDDHLSRPTQSLAQRWFREKHGIVITVVSRWRTEKKLIWYFHISYNYGKGVNRIVSDNIDYPTFEKALDAGLITVAKLLPTKTNS